MGNFLVKAQNTILSAAFILFLSSGANAVLGLIKNRLLAQHIGVSQDLAVFYTADRIPNLIYSVLVVGALSTVFIPIFTESLKKSKEHAFKVASSLINVVLVFFGIFCVIAWIFAPTIMSLLSVGTFSTAELELGVKVMRIMLLSQFLLVGGSMSGSVLQSYKMFLIPALAPLAYNFGVIFGIYFLSDKLGILGPTYGTLIGAFLHFALQSLFLKPTGFKWFPNINIKDTTFKEVITMTPPRIVSVLIANALATVNNSFAILISSASVIYLKFGTQLQSFPVTLFGASIAAASLPTLSDEYDEKDFSKFNKTFFTSLHQMMYLVMPASALMLILRIPIVRLVYGVSNFPWDATIATAQVLGVFALSIFPQSATYLITRAFYAIKDTQTPVKVSLVTIFINILLSLFFVKILGYGVWSVALSFTITETIDMFFMLFYLMKKTNAKNFAEVTKTFVKITLATVLMALTLYIPIKLLDQVIIDTTRTLNLLVLTGIASASGGITYLVFTRMLNIPEIELFYKLVRKLNFKKSAVRESSIENI